MEGTRERAAWALVIAVSLLLVGALAGIVHGGPLDPTGPPGSTGKTVITSLPFTISQPGSYVLNGNLTGVGGQNGITVNAADVTIDLQGFALMGVSGSGDGVHGNSANITVRNGTIRDWSGAGFYSISDAAADGLRLLSNTRGLDLGPRSSVSNCTANYHTGGYAVQVQDRSSVTHCQLENNVNGLRVYQDTHITDTTVVRSIGTNIVGDDRITIENCHVDGGGASATGSNGIQVGSGSVIRGCTVINHAAVEILAGARSVLENCVADGFGGPGDGISVGEDSVIRACTSDNNNGRGIFAGDGSTITGCAARNNGLNGIEAGQSVSIGGCTSNSNKGSGILIDSGSTLEGCTAQANTGLGIVMGDHSVMKGCTATNNGMDEIFAGSEAKVEDCGADGAGSGGRGITVGPNSIVRNCTATNNGDVEIFANDGSLIEDSVANGFTGSVAGPGNGIVVNNDSVVRGCNSRFNAGIGIRAQGQLNRIEGNRSYDNGTYGFTAEGGANVGMQNSAGFNSTANYGINPGNQFVVVTGTAGQTNPFANVQ